MKASARWTSTRPRSMDCTGTRSSPSPRCDHILPHVFEEVGEQRQGAGILDRFLGGAPSDVAGKMLGLEPSGEQSGGRLTTSSSCASRSG